MARPALAINVHPEAPCNDLQILMRQSPGFFRIPARIYFALSTFLPYRIRHHSGKVALLETC